MATAAWLLRWHGSNSPAALPRRSTTPFGRQPEGKGIMKRVARTFGVVSAVVAVVSLSGRCLAGLTAGPQATLAAGDSILGGTFDLTAPRSHDPQRYDMETRVITYAPDGDRVERDVFKLELTCTPGSVTAEDADQYTCNRFSVQFGAGPEVEIPALAGWAHLFVPGLDKKGQVFGVDHARFENLVDANGQPLPVDKAYLVYNSFIDFHGFCNLFARPTADGRGVQDLTRIGEKIVHAAAFSEAPVSLGTGIKEGSTFKNGEITLEFKGLSLVDGARCAILAYDSGESSFQMLMEPMPDMEVRTVGSSHYYGDIYIDLATGWARKVTMGEVVVSETTVPGLPNKIDAAIERNLTIRNISKGDDGRNQ